MTSVVDTSVKLFTSQMSGAPALSGVAGALIALLDACAKDGFDLKTLTSLTVAGGVATAGYTGTHSAMVDTVVLIAGVTGGPSGWAGLNGEQKITGKPGATSVSFATNLPDGTYTGTITMKMAPLGFAKPFSGPNLAAYRSQDPMSSGMYLRVDDTAAMNARVIGCESMSDIATYAGPFPSALQISGGGHWGKSTQASSTAVQWALIGDARGFYLHVCPGYATSATYTQGFTRGFGDALAFKPGGDPYGCFLSWSVSATPQSQTDGQPEYNAALQQSFPRGPSGLGTTVLYGCYPYTGNDSVLSGSDTLFGTFPNPIDGSLRMSKRYFATGSNGAPPRAELPGLYSIPHNNCLDSFKFGDRVPGSGALVGKNFFVVNPTSTTANQVPSSGNSGVTLFDITGPWPR